MQSAIKGLDRQAQQFAANLRRLAATLGWQRSLDAAYRWPQFTFLTNLLKIQLFDPNPNLHP